MRFAVDVPNFGDFADPRVVADLARRAEEAGWDGLFVWDHVTHRKKLRRAIADPWVLLTAAALATERATAGLGGEPFDLVMSGTSPAAPAAAADLVGPLAEAGATWWAECVWDDLERAEPVVRRVDQGPPPVA
jgi:Luciferase-like monooxygenase